MWGKHISFHGAGIGFVLFAGFDELFVGAVVGSLGGGGIALQEDEGAGGVVDEGAGEHGVEAGVRVEAEHAADHGGFKAADAGQPPARVRHFLDEEAFVRVGGREGGAIIGD
jgi:hypothetical protein